MRGMLARDLIDLLVPPTCLVCRAAGRTLCAGCRRALPWLVGPCCLRCGMPAPCGRSCPAATHAFTAAWAPFAHEGPARTLVARLKFQRATAATGVLAAAMAATVPTGLLDGVTLVPVPANPDHRRVRGIDHARLLARALGRRTGTPVASRALRRRADAARQLGADRRTRLSAGRIDVLACGVAPALRIVLVDDVHTTGATLDACARALLAAGADEVSAVTAVRALR